MAAPFLVWDPKKLTTQVPDMDKEHIRLIELMNQLHDAHAENKDFSIQHKILTQLVQWTVTHFKHEEDFFSTLPYTHAETHKNIHKELLKRLQDYDKKFQVEKKLTNEFFMFLKVWLSAHIMGIDSKYGQIAVDNGKVPA